MAEEAKQGAEKTIENMDDANLTQVLENYTPENEAIGKLKRVKWDNSKANKDDTLLSCLEIISGLLDRPMSAAAFKAGLPLNNNRMAPEQFLRAASRAGLSARIVQKKIHDISSFTLPCVLLLDGNKACILTKLNKEGMAEILIPETGKGVTEISIGDLSMLYAGYAIFVKPQYKYDKRSSDLRTEHPNSWFWGVIWKFWPTYSKVILSAVLVNLFAIAVPLFSMNIYDRVVPNFAIDTLIALSIGILIVFLFDFILKTLRVYFIDSAGKNADIILASKLFEHVMNMRMSHKPHSSGAFANELREFETLREFFSSATLVAIIDLPFVFLFLLIVIMIGGPIAWIPGIAIPLIILGSLIFHAPLNAWVKRSFREGAQKHALLIEAINGVETVKTFSAEGQVQKNWETFVAQSADSSRYLRLFATIAMNWTGFIQQLAYIGVIVSGVFLINSGDLSMGGLIACSILASKVTAPLGQVVGLMTKFNQSQTALEALNKLLEMPVERPKGTNFVHRPKLYGNIDFTNVVFTYPGQKLPALRDFNLHLEAGERVGILGRIGSGKSTLEKLLLGLYHVDDGSASIDGTDIRQIDPADLRTNIGYIPQDIYLFYGTVRENIIFGASDIDDSTIIRAAEISGAMDFIKVHPQGFDMHVGEGGSCLSGGQRQAIAVARAIIRNPSIYLFDEPTAMMDHASESRLIANLEPTLEGKTLLLITHRMLLLKLVNRLVIIDGGKIVADGPRDDVLKALASSQIRAASGTGA